MLESDDTVVSDFICVMGEFMAAAMTALTVSIAANITLDCFGNRP